MRSLSIRIHLKKTTLFPFDWRGRRFCPSTSILRKQQLFLCLVGAGVRTFRPFPPLQVPCLDAEEVGLQRANASGQTRTGCAVRDARREFQGSNPLVDIKQRQSVFVCDGHQFQGVPVPGIHIANRSDIFSHTIMANHGKLEALLVAYNT